MYNAAYNSQQQGAFAPTDRGAILSGLRRGGPSPPLQQQHQGYGGAPPPRHSGGYSMPQQYPGYGAPAQQQSYAGYGQPQPPQQQQGQPDVAAMMQQLRLQASRDIEQLRQRTDAMTAAFLAQQQQEQQRQTFSSNVFSPPLPHGSFQPQQIYAGNQFAGVRNGGYNADPYHHHQQMASPPMRAPTYGQGFQAPSQPMPASVATPPMHSMGGFVGHHRHQSSVGSSGSSVLSAGGILSSPSGPAVVLSKPGDAYPAAHFSSPTKATTTTKQHTKRDSDASSSGSESFDSVNTSVSSGSRTATDSSKDTVVDAPQLRPNAVSFSPKVVTIPVMSPPPIRFGGNGSGQRQPLQLASRRAGTAGGGPNALGVSIIRQPRGAIAVDDDEFSGQNFAGRIRQQGRKNLGLLSRRTNSPGPVVEDSLQYAQQQILSQMQAA